MKVNLNNRLFRLVSSMGSAEVDIDVLFHYRQEDDVVWGTYKGGPVRMGTITGRFVDEHIVEFNYQHLNKENILMTGFCRSTISKMENSLLRLDEKWHWTNGDLSSGVSIVEEIKREDAENSK